MKYLEKIHNDDIWHKTKKKIVDDNLPKTLEIVAKFPGIFAGKLLGNII